MWSRGAWLDLESFAKLLSPLVYTIRVIVTVNFQQRCLLQQLWVQTASRRRSRLRKVLFSQESLILKFTLKSRLAFCFHALTHVKFHVMS